MNDRDANGRFLPGNQAAKGGGGGRPRRSTEEKYLKALITCLTLKDFKDIVEMQIVQALRGDNKATRLLFEYVIGKPMQYVAMDANVKHDNVSALTDAQVAQALADLAGRVEADISASIDGPSTLGGDSGQTG